MPFGSPFWMRHPPPATPVPSVWPWGFSSFDPQVGSQHLATMTSSVFPYPMGPPPPYSSVSPALNGDASGHYLQVEWQIPASSAFPAAVGGLSRGAPHLERCQAPPSEWALGSAFEHLAPPCSPELCPLPPSPTADRQPDPFCPRSPRPPCRACRRLF